MRIVQLSTRLRSGGAATVAASLDARFVAEGHETQFLYGYGPRGRREPNESAHERAVTTRTQAIASYTASRLVGFDLSFPGQEGRLARHFKAADVVQLHIVHSHLASFRVLVDALRRAGKPVVWTHHDQWALTGRCAFTDDCGLFAEGCGRCPRRGAYPGTLLDLSARGWQSRRRAIGRLGPDVPLQFVAVADWLAARLRDQFPEIPCQVIRNGASEIFLRTDGTRPGPKKGRGSRPTVLVVASDLSDSSRVDVSLLRRLVGEVPEARLVVVGRRPPPGLPASAEIRGEIADRAALREEFRSADVFLFMCRVDTAPMVVVEASLSGTPTVALRGASSEELCGMLGMPTYASESDVISAVAERKYLDVDVDDLQRRARSVFDPVERARDYLSLYSRTG